jgi:hypothetical protein
MMMVATHPPMISEKLVRSGSRAGEADAIPHHHTTPFIGIEDDDDGDDADGAGPS